MNTHSGSANAGHYWSYINTRRGIDEPPGGDPTWLHTEKEPWMEFNDSRVSDFDFVDLKDKCFGTKQTSRFTTDKYGCSGYMLFYERRKKKDLKILVEEDQVQAQKDLGFDVKYDEEKKESYKMVNYRKSTDDEQPNKIYQKVFEDNKKYGFETDIYSTEFFQFVLGIMGGIASLEDPDSDGAKLLGLDIGKKVGLEILARCLKSTAHIE